MRGAVVSTVVAVVDAAELAQFGRAVVTCLVWECFVFAVLTGKASFRYWRGSVGEVGVQVRKADGAVCLSCYIGDVRVLCLVIWCDCDCGVCCCLINVVGERGGGRVGRGRDCGVSLCWKL